MWRGVRAEQSARGVGRLASGGTTLRHHVLVAAMVLLVVAACGGGDDPMTVTLTSGDCTYSGPESVAAGPVSIAVVNETGNLAVFDFHRINETHTYADLASHIDEEQARMDAGTDTVGPPPYTTIIDAVLFLPTDEDRSAAEADGLTVFLVGEEGSLDTTLTAGIYAVVCVAPDAGSIRIAGPFEATE